MVLQALSGVEIAMRDVGVKFLPGCSVGAAIENTQTQSSNGACCGIAILFMVTLATSFVRGFFVPQNAELLRN